MDRTPSRRGSRAAGRCLQRSVARPNDHGRCPPAPRVRRRPSRSTPCSRAPARTAPERSSTGASPCTRAGRGRATRSPPSRATACSRARSCSSTPWSPTSCGTHRRCPRYRAPRSASRGRFAWSIPAVRCVRSTRPTGSLPDGTPVSHYWVRLPEGLRHDRGAASRGRVVSARLHDRHRDAAASRHGAHRRRAPHHLDRCHLPHRALPRSRPHRRLAPRRERGVVRRQRSRVREPAWSSAATAPSSPPSGKTPWSAFGAGPDRLPARDVAAP